MNFPILNVQKARCAAVLVVLASFFVSNIVAASPAGDGSKTKAVVRTTALTTYTTDLTQLGREGRLRENLNFDTETNRLMNVLGKGGVRQPVMLNDDKAAQETIVEQLALRIANGTAPADLLAKRVVKIETASLFSNAKTAADADAALTAIIQSAVSSKKGTIIYADELTNLLASNGAQGSHHGWDRKWCSEHYRS